MASKNIALKNTTYNGVESVELPISGGGSALFVETSDSDASASDIAQGKTAYVNGVKVTGTAQGGSANIDPLTVTQNGTYTASGGVDGYSPVTVNVSGGGGIGNLLVTKALGELSTTSTSEVATGQTLTISSATDYDMIITEISVDSPTNGQHLATASIVVLPATSNITTRSGINDLSRYLIFKLTSAGVAQLRYSTTGSGVYAVASAQQIVDESITLNINMRYNSTNSGTVNGTYTARVYGLNLYELIDG